MTTIPSLLGTKVVNISFKKGQKIYTENSSIAGVYCIQMGKVKLFKNCDDKNITVSLASNSDLIGYRGLFYEGSHIESAKCLEDSTICFIPKSTFMQLIIDNNELKLTLLKNSSREINGLLGFIKDLKCKNMRGRVISTLKELNNKFGTDLNGCLDISLTRKEISELSGTTTESVIRILNDLKKEKVIDFIDKRIKILDFKKLNRIKY